MATISLQTPTINQPFSTEAPKVDSNFVTLQTWANGNIDAVNLSPALAQLASVSQSGQAVAGSTLIATSEARTNTAYGTLTTPDQVANIVLSANGIIRVWYQATWKESVLGAASAGLFLGANLVQFASGNQSAQAVTTIVNQTNANLTRPLSSYPLGLVSEGNSVNSNYVGDVTTGQAIGDGILLSGGSCDIFAAAGTYTVSVQFKATSGTVTASNRRLYVQAISFA